MNDDRASAQALRKALTLLGKRNLSREELRQRLLKKDLPLQAIDNALRVCMAQGYIDEEERGGQIIRAGLRSGHGPLRIQSDLKKRGIPESLRENLMETLKDGEKTFLSGVALRKLGKIREKDNVKRMATLYRFLLSRGFASSDILDLIHGMDAEKSTS